MRSETQERGSQRRRNERTLIIEKLALCDDFFVGLKRKPTKAAQCAVHTHVQTKSCDCMSKSCRYIFCTIHPARIVVRTNKF